MSWKKVLSLVFVCVALLLSFNSNAFALRMSDFPDALPQIGTVMGVPTSGAVTQGFLKQITYEPNDGYFDKNGVKYKNANYKYHHGVDIAGGQGLNITPIYAMAGGVVVYAGLMKAQDIKKGYGHQVIIYHDGISDPDKGIYIYSMYGHMGSKVDGKSFIESNIVSGQRVAGGQLLGKQGNSGNTSGATGVHLDFEIRVSNTLKGVGQWTNSTRWNMAAVSPNFYLGVPLDVTDGDNILKRVTATQPPTSVTLNNPVNSSSNTISLSWSQNNDTSFGTYKLYRAEHENVTTSDTLVATITDRTVLNYSDTDLPSGVTYYYKLFVFNTAGWSADSNDVKLPLLNGWQRFRITTDPKRQSTPDIYGNKIVWLNYLDENQTSTNIYLYDINTGIARPIIASESSIQSNVHIHGDNVVYVQDKFNGSYEKDIYVCNIISKMITKVSTDDRPASYANYPNSGPDICSDKIVWAGVQGIYLYDLVNMKNTLIGSNITGTSFQCPKIADNWIVWEDVKTGWIYVYDFASKVPIKTDILSNGTTGNWSTHGRSLVFYGWYSYPNSPYGVHVYDLSNGTVNTLVERPSEMPYMTDLFENKLILRQYNPGSQIYDLGIYDINNSEEVKLNAGSYVSNGRIDSNIVVWEGNDMDSSNLDIYMAVYNE